MQVFIVEHGVDPRTIRAFWTWKKAANYVIREARKLDLYDKSAEQAHPAARGGPAEYAAAQLGALIHELKVD